MSNIKALLIGINYTNTRIKQLRGCVNDAQLSMQYLISIGVPLDNITLITDDRVTIETRGSGVSPTRSNLLREIRTFVNSGGTNDILFFYFSGHGTQRRNKFYSVIGEGLVTLDSVDSIWTYDSVLSDDEFESLILSAKCKAVYVLIDACFGEGTIEHFGIKVRDASEIVREAVPTGVIQKIKEGFKFPPPSTTRSVEAWGQAPPFIRALEGTRAGPETTIVAFSAGHKGEPCVDSKILSAGCYHGLFTYYFFRLALDHLINDGGVKTTDYGNWDLIDDAASRMQARQVPALVVSNTAANTWRFLTTTRSPTARTRSVGGQNGDNWGSTSNRDVVPYGSRNVSDWESNTSRDLTERDFSGRKTEEHIVASLHGIYGSKIAGEKHLIMEAFREVHGIPKINPELKDAFAKVVALATANELYHGLYGRAAVDAAIGGLNLLLGGQLLQPHPHHHHHHHHA